MDIKNTLIQELFKFIINGQNIQKNRGLLNSNNNKRKRQIKGDKGGIKTVWGIWISLQKNKVKGHKYYTIKSFKSIEKECLR